MNVAIAVQNLKKSFNGIEVFRDFAITVESGKITAIFGPNGSGKSTLLNILSGVSTFDGGEVSIKNFDHFRLSYIFQNYRESLLPWRTNFENIALPLEIQKKSTQEIKKKIEALQKIFEFECNWDGYPYELSGGQQQVLAFMRALVTDPRILFIDEPFSALDYENSLRLREHLQSYYLLYKPTILLVTHDIEEAVHLAEKIVVFSRKPTTTQGEVANHLPYPRTILSLKSEQFHEVKDRVLSVFQKATSL